MFNWFRPKTIVVDPFAAELARAESKDPNTFYSIGLTNDKRLSLKIGPATLTMGKTACEEFLKHMRVFVDTLPDDSEDDKPKT
jgi:hypothetical protein